MFLVKYSHNNTVDSLISGQHKGNDFCPLIGGVRVLESLFLTFCDLGRGTLILLILFQMIMFEIRIT